MSTIQSRDVVFLENSSTKCPSVIIPLDLDKTVFIRQGDSIAISPCFVWI